MLKKIIPHAITSANLFCGCVAITQIAIGNLAIASLLVLLGAFFDFFDGMAARFLKVTSPLGAQLDSLADVITFGVVPAYLAFSWLNQIEPTMFNYLAFLIAIFSAVRLGKFNIDTRQTDSFIGLPTPANALFWISLPLTQWQVENQVGLIQIKELMLIFEQAYLIFGFIVLLSFLLIAELPLIALKFKNLSWNSNQFRWILLISSLVLIVLFLFAAIPIILLLYLTLSIIQTSTNKHDEIQS
ncbi:MAG: CDP-diacylglycerol--serine O-phosphatidyltransferase [Vicingaceae bacterium]